MKCLREFLTEGSYTKELEMTFPRCDLHRRAKLSTLLSFVADVAGRDYDARELPYDRLLAMRQVFLLSRITLHITRLPQMEALLSVTTREDGIHAAHLMRNFVMEDAQGVCVSARSAWILVDPVTRKILRPESFQGKVVCDEHIPLDCPPCTRVPLPKAELSPLGVREIRYSDLDCNGHVYSGNYGNIVWDYLPQELQDKALREFTIQYQREALRGERLTLAGMTLADGSYLMRATGGGEPCFSCRCTF